MAANAARALKVRQSKPQSQRGMTAVGLARANQLIRRDPISLETVKRIKAYFDRHVVDKRGSTWSEQGKGWQAWMGWGGDEGWAWVKEILAQETRKNPEDDEDDEGEPDEPDYAATFPSAAFMQELSQKLEERHERGMDTFHEYVNEGLEHFIGDKHNREPMKHEMWPYVESVTQSQLLAIGENAEDDYFEIDELFDEALADINVWQSYNPGGDGYVQAMVRRGAGRDVRWEASYEVDEEFGYDDFESLSAWLNTFDDRDAAEEWLEDEWENELDLDTHLDGGRFKGFFHARSSGEVRTEVYFHDDVEPTVSVEAFKETFQRLLEEKYPELGESPEVRTAREAREAAELEEVIDLSNGPKRVRPYVLLNLTKPSQLKAESNDMRHCVGKPEHGYPKAVAEGRIQIWSLRTKGGKRKFTFEVRLRGGEPESIDQIKGKPNNRLPGWQVNAVGKEPFNAEEAQMLVDLVDYLIAEDVINDYDGGPEVIDDLAPAMKYMGLIDETRVRKNPSSLRSFKPKRTFDKPWTPPR